MQIKIFMSLLLLTMVNATHAQEWYAMARHGECTELEKLNERHSLVRGARSPHQMEEMLKIAGVDYTLESMIPGQEGILKLNVTSESWAMILVRKQFCQEFLGK